MFTERHCPFNYKGNRKFVVHIILFDIRLSPVFSIVPNIFQATVLQ